MKALANAFAALLVMCVAVVVVAVTIGFVRWLL